MTKLAPIVEHNIQAVAKGTLDGSTVTYELFELR